MLEPIRKSLREKRVYATTVDGTVLSLRAGADLQEALAKLRERSGTPGQGPIAARVNGRASGIRQQASYHLATIVGDVLYTQAIKLMHEASCEVGAPEALTTTTCQLILG